MTKQLKERLALWQPVWESGCFYVKTELRSFKQITVTREMGKGVKAKIGFQVSICFYFHPTGYSVAAQGRKNY